MRLFNRKTEEDPEPVCATCGERVPEEAATCAMCGTPFGDATPAPAATDAEPEPASRLP